MENETENQQIPAETVPESAPYRLNLILDPEAKRGLEELKTRTRKSRYVDVIKAALALYKIVAEHQETGGRIVFRHPNNSEETLRLL